MELFTISVWGGRATPLVFFAGINGTAFQFLRIADLLASQYRVLSLTRRGNGRSDKPEKGYDIDTLVEDIYGFIEALNIDSAFVAGYSFGGIEVTSFATNYVPSKMSATD